MELDVEPDDSELAGGSHESSLSRTGVNYGELRSRILIGLEEEFEEASVTELKVYCMDLPMDAQLQSQLFSVTKLVPLITLLLQYTNNDLRLLMLTLNDLAPKVIRDLNPQLRKDMAWLAEKINKDNEVFDLKRQVLYGRGTQLEQLLSLMNFDKERNIRLINVCGMTGIGKTFLIKHFGSRLITKQQHVVLYADARGLSDWSDLLTKLLENVQIDCVPSACEETLQKTLYEFLFKNNENEFAIIIDDLSTLMTSGPRLESTSGPKSESASGPKSESKILSKLNEFIMATVKLKLKIVVTSQIYFTSSNVGRASASNNQAEYAELSDIKAKMADYVKDISLGRLSNEEAMNFFGPSMHHMTRQNIMEMVERCSGHPYSLDIVSALANSDSSCTTEISRVSSVDIDAFSTTLAAHMFEKTFTRLEPKMYRLVLLAVSLFERDAQLGALFKIVNPGRSKDEFYNDVKKKFSDGFWLTFRVCDLKSESGSKTVVNTHHPLILKFLRKKVDSYLDDQKCDEYDSIVMLKERYIARHITELIDIGKQCVSERLSRRCEDCGQSSGPCSICGNSRANFIERTCGRFNAQKANVKGALRYMLNSPNSYKVLFLKTLAGTELREDSDIIHLFITIHEFYDCFDGKLMEVLTVLFHTTISDMNQERALLWTLYVMVLAVEQDWQTLDPILRQPGEPNNLEQINQHSQDLYSFCQVIYFYASGRLCTLKLKETPVPRLVKKQKDALTSALHTLSHELVSPDWKGARSYFSVQIFLLQAEITHLADQSSISLIQEACTMCKKAKKAARDVATILEPVVCIKLALYKSIHGDLCEGSCITEPRSLYIKAQCYHKRAIDHLKKRGIQMSTAAGTNHLNFGIVLRSLSALMATKGNTSLPPTYKKDGQIYLEDALVQFREAIYIFEMMNSVNRLELLNSYVDTGETYEKRSTCYPSKDQAGNRKNSFNALQYYKRAYNVIYKSYRECHLAANELTLKHLLQRLPVLLRTKGHPEAADKVEHELRKLLKELHRSADDKFTPGSALYVHGSSESSSDDSTGSPGNTSGQLV